MKNPKEQIKQFLKKNGKRVIESRFRIKVLEKK